MATNAAVTTTDSPSAMGTLITTPINPDEPADAMQRPRHHQIQRDEEQHLARQLQDGRLNGCPLDWK